MKKYLLVGMGETNKEVIHLIKADRGEVVATDDTQDNEKIEEIIKFCAELDVDFHSQPSFEEYAVLSKEVDYCIPTPALPDSHLIYKVIKKHKKFISELDLATNHTKANIVAITGTNGKSTVAELVKDALLASGVKTMACGNLDISFSRAVMENPSCETYVVEASSFGLRHAQYFAPKVAAWLNFSPNHLSNHKNLKAYEKAKAKIWERIGEDDCWIANADDSVVWRNRPKKGHSYIFENDENNTVKSNNENAARLIASAATASPEGIEKSLKDFKGLSHRMQEIANIDGIAWFNDSKATNPHAVKAGVAGMGKVVLIAGGRDQSKEISELRHIKNIKALVAIGESSDELKTIFTDICPFEIAQNMEQAVLMSYEFAKNNEANSVILSPGGASFDWYGSYKERGDDFIKAVKELENKKAVK